MNADEMMLSRERQKEADDRVASKKKSRHQFGCGISRRQEKRAQDKQAKQA
jgi:hypothetical protein